MISVIVPVFNTQESLLRACINSVLRQKEQNFELLIVDDGSDRGTKAILASIESIDNRITVISQKNSGAACARRMGVSKAKGKYLAFLDSDDELMPEFLNESVFLSKEYDADLVIGGRQNYWSGIAIGAPAKVSIPHPQTMSPDQIRHYFMSGSCPRDTPSLNSLNTKSLVSKLYRSSCFQNLPIPPCRLKYAEDVYENLLICERLERVVLSPNIWYKRNIVSNSTSYGYCANGIEEALKSARTFLDYAYNHSEYDLKNDALSRVLQCAHNGLETEVFHADARLSFRERLSKIGDLLDSDIMQETFANLNRQHLFPVKWWSLAFASNKLDSPLVILAGHLLDSNFRRFRKLF